ncbi:MAG: bifunctional diaminohydroxyphosphoribosylaminopyrimidine deaminase/5-amino-6-(5-phosphoribosylamino)uracil reductase RibD [Kiloniellales bacterium]
MTTADPADRRHMLAALALARRGLGRVWPNPAVGCVLVAGGRAVGRGWTQPGGRPHAETEALGRAGMHARGATAYVTLEPCSHHAASPPCTAALIDAGVKRALIALEDPDPRVSGSGIARLRDSGVEVEVGLCGEAAAAVNAGFLKRVTEGRPLVTWKTATTLDGRIATHGLDSTWITGEAARARAHLLRASHDAVLIGAATAAEDDPMLDCRLPGLEDRSPVRVVVDAHLRLPLTAKLVSTAGRLATWLVTCSGGDRERLAAYRKAGVKIIKLAPDRDGYPDPGNMLRRLAARGLTRVLVEGGSHIAAALLRRDLVDRIAWFRAGKVVGGDGVPAAQGFGVERLDNAPGFERQSVIELGPDLLELLTRRR